MIDASQSLIAASAGIVFALSSIHLCYTFFGNAFSPRDGKLKMRIKAVSPLLTREITMWNAWIGFNASHSLGAMLFDALYAYLALGLSSSIAICRGDGLGVLSAKEKDSTTPFDHHQVASRSVSQRLPSVLQVPVSTRRKLLYAIPSVQFLPANVGTPHKAGFL